MTERWSELADGTRVRLRGGATDADVAAVVTALSTRAEEEAERGRRLTRPAWLTAALREGLGAAPAAEPGDLRGLA